MSGWNTADKMMDEDTGSDFPSMNNITVAGYMPHDQVAAPARSRSVVEAHMKSLRLFRKYCRYMPFVINYFGYRKYTNPEQAKMQLANYWRQNNKVRSIDNIDMFVRAGYERLYSMQNGDVWGSIILDQLAPIGRGTVQRNEGFSTLEDFKYGKKTRFLKDFYMDPKKPNF